MAAVVEETPGHLLLATMSRASCRSFLLCGQGVVFLLVLCAVAKAASAPTGTEVTPVDSYPGVFGPDARQGYVLRQESWNGTLPVGDNTPIRQQLFKENDYRFYVWTDVKGARVSVHVYDQDGNLIDGRTSQKANGESHFDEVDVRPTATGSYFLIVKVEQSSAKSTTWQMAYAYK